MRRLATVTPIKMPATAYKVVSDVPIPEFNHAKKTYPFAEMNIGDSFVASFEQLTRVRSAASAYGIRTDKKFSVRKINRECRCWRVS